MMRQLLLALIAVCTGISTFAQDRITGATFATRSPVYAQRGMAATSHPLATQVAIDILQRGGTAVDAAIAANATLGLMEPTGCGIGGDIFAIVWDAKTQQLYGLNGSGRSPQNLPLSYFQENGYDKIPAYGPLPVSVPGCVDGWFMLHDRFGKLTMEDILSPAIRYAENGFPVTDLIAYYLNLSANRFKDYPHFADVWMPQGNPPAAGTIFQNLQLASTYRALIAGGRDAFYTGGIATTIATFLQEQGGFLTVEDLANHKGEWVTPVSTNYRGYDVWELPPNGQGIAALQMLNLLELYDVASMGFGSADYLHLLTEVKKLVYEDRARYYADPDFAAIPVVTLISKEYAQQRAALFNLQRAARSVPAGELTANETIYLTVADSMGNMVSLIQSNYRGMGSGMVPPGLGFMLQDRGELFSLEEGHANVYAPGKRPFQTIIPAFITKDGMPWCSFGVMGGAMQPQGHVQIIVNLIDFGMNLQEAGDAPRIQHIGSSEPTGEEMTDGGILLLETGFHYAVIRELIGKGHTIQFDVGGYGGYQAIMKDMDNQLYVGASESRKDGQASGY